MAPLIEQVPADQQIECSGLSCGPENDAEKFLVAAFVRQQPRNGS